jgi:hypothetical protein
MITRKGIVLFCTLTLGVCARGTAGSGPHPDSVETPAVTSTGETGDDPASIQPKLSAGQILLRLLELIRESDSVEDFTPEHLSRTMGVEIEYARDGSGRYGFGEAVTTEWNHGFEADLKTKSGARFSFSFDSAPGSSPPMTDICQVDFDRFTAELEAMGFTRQRYYGEHGRFINDWFDRPGGMRVEVYPRGEHVWTAERGSGRTCVKMVLIP